MINGVKSWWQVAWTILLTKWTKRCNKLRLERTFINHSCIASRVKTAAIIIHLAIFIIILAGAVFLSWWTRVLHVLSLFLSLLFFWNNYYLWTATQSTITSLSWLSLSLSSFTKASPVDYPCNLHLYWCVKLWLKWQ